MRPDDRRPPHRSGLILLAAGGSTRLGSPKQLLPFGGRTLLRHAAETAVGTGCAPLVVVLGANTERLCPELDGLPVEIALNTAWEEGMASSVVCGIAALARAEIDRACVMLCDQPFVTPATIAALVQAVSKDGKQAAVCEYATGETGPPCVFRRDLFPALLALRGAQGAKAVLRAMPEGQIARVPFPDGKFDVDTQADWDRIRDRHAVGFATVPPVP